MVSISTVSARSRVLSTCSDRSLMASLVSRLEAASSRCSDAWDGDNSCANEGKAKQKKKIIHKERKKDFLASDFSLSFGTGDMHARKALLRYAHWKTMHNRTDNQGSNLWKNLESKLWNHCAQSNNFRHRLPRKSTIY